MVPTVMDDATLVSRAVGGDRDAFAALYDRYSAAVYDLCTAILRNPEEAADATLDSFLRAARELVNLRDRSRLRLWLLAVARLEARSRADGRREEATPEAGGPGEAQGWDPAGSLSVDDRAVLDLHLRHQLEGEELGAVIGLRPAAADARAARLRAMAETSVGALLLSRPEVGGGGGDPSPCAGLAQVLEGWDGRFTPAMGVRINRHAKGCDACQARRTMLLERLQAMATLPFPAAPEWLRPELMLRMELAVSSRTASRLGRGRLPAGHRRRRGSRGTGRSWRSGRSAGSGPVAEVGGRRDRGRGAGRGRHPPRHPRLGGRFDGERVGAVDVDPADGDDGGAPADDCGAADDRAGGRRPDDVAPAVDLAPGDHGAAGDRRRSHSPSPSPSRRAPTGTRPGSPSGPMPPPPTSTAAPTAARACRPTCPTSPRSPGWRSSCAARTGWRSR